jgi:hypothetical protein
MPIWAKVLCASFGGFGLILVLIVVLIVISSRDDECVKRAEEYVCEQLSEDQIETLWEEAGKDGDRTGKE